MYSIINEYDFTHAFKTSNRSDEFSYHALQALYEWLEEVYCTDDYGVELDVVALCCEWTQYKSIEEYNEAYETEYESYQELEEANVCEVIHVEGDEFICGEH